MGRYSKHGGLHAGMIQADRWQIDRASEIRFWSGAVADCLVTNISRFGFRMKCDVSVTPGQTVWLEMDAADPLLATVIWSEPNTAGCQFAVPLGEAVYSEIILGSPGPDRLDGEIYI